MKKYIEVKISLPRTKNGCLSVNAKKMTDGFWDTIKEFDPTAVEQATEFAHDFAKKCSKGNRNIIWVLDDNKRPIGAYINGEKRQPRY